MPQLEGPLVVPAILCASTNNLVAAEMITPSFPVLVFSKTTGFRHDSIPDGIAVIRAFGIEHGFSVDAT
jgi:cytochrome c